METIYLAGGCFWGVEQFFSQLPGVKETKVGYANSIIEKPTYEDVKKHKTDALEAVEIVYDETIISKEKLLDGLFLIIDPTLVNQQGNDVGSQYQSAVFVNTKEEMDEINKYIASKVQPKYQAKVMTKILVLENFYDAEEYHQKYLVKNVNGYCHINVIGKLDEYNKLNK